MRKANGLGRWLPAAALVVLASQIYVSLYDGALQISVAAVLLPVLSFLFRELSVSALAALAAPGVFLLRLVFQYFAEGTIAGGWERHGPELLFYLTYGALLALYLRKTALRPVRLIRFLPLVGIDACANFVELAVRMGAEALAPAALLRLVAVGAVRTLLAYATVRMLEAYSFQVLRREDAERYRRLLLMTAALKGEVAWMDKGTVLIENTMNSAYHLYSQLRSDGGAPALTETALSVAKDIHEVKKEYYLIMRGISEALDTEAASPGMEWRELVELLERTAVRTAEAMGKRVTFTVHSTDGFYTRKHHYLMSIFHNLLTNAMEAASADGDATLVLTQRRTGESRCFSFSDDCGGIPPARLEQVFAPGFSSKINPNTGEINRGLGLTIVKDLVEERLRGRVTVTCPSGGTVFTIEIPAGELEE